MSVRATVDRLQVRGIDRQVGLLRRRARNGEVAATSLDGRLDTAEADITTAEGAITTTQGNLTTLAGRVTTAEGEIDALQAKIQHGTATVTNCGPNTGDEGDVAITFSPSFAATPRVLVSQGVTTANFSMSLVYAASTTGATLRVRRIAGGGNITLSWLAVGA